MSQIANSTSRAMVIHQAMVRLYRAGGGLPEQAGWPFVKITIDAGLLGIKLFGTNLSLTPDTIARLEEYSQAYAFGKPAHERGIRIILAQPLTSNKRLSPISSIEVSFRAKDFDTIIQSLRASGFSVAMA